MSSPDEPELPTPAWVEPLVWCTKCKASDHLACRGWTDWCTCGCGVEWFPDPRVSYPGTVVPPCEDDPID